MNPFDICDITMPPYRIVVGPKELFPDFVDTEPERTSAELRSFLLSADMYLGGAQQLRDCANRWSQTSRSITPATDHREVVGFVMQSVEAGQMIGVIAAAADMAAVTDSDIRNAGADKRLMPSASASGGTVGGMRFDDKLMRCLEYVPDQIGEKLGAQAKAEIEGLFSPTNIAITAGILAVWAGSHVVGVGFVVDGILLGVGLLFAGWEALKAFEKIGEFFKAVNEANSDRDLVLAAGLLASAIAILGVAGFKALLRRVTPKTPKGGGETKKGGQGSTGTARQTASADTKRPTQKPTSEPTKDAPPPKKAKPEQRPPVASPTAAQTKAAAELKVDPRWVKPNGDIDWPPNDGFAGPPKTTTLQPGAKIDRYGGYNQNGQFKDKGSYTSPAGVAFEKRALPNATLDKPYKKYEVVRPIPDVLSGDAAPWFGHPGGGTQYKMPMNMDDLLEQGYIRPID